MKKIILSAAILAVAGLSTVKANTISKNPVAITAQQDSLQKTAVKLDELPDAVKATLKSDTYKDWTASSAVLVKSGTTSYYEITAKKGDQTNVVKIGADGKAI